MSNDHCCLPEPGGERKAKRRGQIAVVIVIVVFGLSYPPAMLSAGASSEIVAMTAPAVIGLAVEVVRRFAAHIWPAAGACQAAA